MFKKTLAAVSLLASQSAMAISSESSLAQSIQQSGSAIDSYISSLSKSEADKVKYCAYLKIAVPLHNKSMGRFAEECGSAGESLLVKQREIKKSQGSINDSTATIKKKKPTADLTDAAIEQSVIKSAQNSVAQIPAILEEISGLAPKIREQKSVVEKKEATVANQKKKCFSYRGLWGHFGGRQAACLSQVQTSTEMKEFTTEKNKLSALEAADAQLEKKLGVAIAAGTQDKSVAVMKIKKSRDDARLVIKAENAKLESEKEKLKSLLSAAEKLQMKLADLDAGSDLCGKNGAKTVPKVCQ